MRFHRVALQFLSRRVAPDVFEICQKEAKEKRREGGKKKRKKERKREEKKKDADARVHTRERAGKLVGNNESIFQTVENGSMPASRSETVAVWPMNFNARPDNNKGAFIGQFLGEWLGRPSGSSAVQTANH